MALGHGSSIVRDGLVLHLDAANSKSYPGSGSTWYDLSGNGNHGILYNSPTFSNNRLFFDGTQYASIAYNANTFDFRYEQTIMITLCPTENDTVRRNPYNQSYGGSGTWTHEPNGVISFYYGQRASGNNGAPYTVYGSAVVSQNETAIMCTVRSLSGSFRKWYKNSTVTSNLPGAVYDPVSLSTQPILIGWGYAGYYIGYIDTVMVYNTSLTDSQVKQNFNALRGRYGI